MFYVTIGSGEQNFQRCKLDGSDIGTNGFMYHKSTFMPNYVPVTSRVAAIDDVLGLCIITNDSGLPMKCVGKDKLDISNADFGDIYFTFKDKPFVSDEVSLGGAKDGIFIKADSATPIGTSFKFEVATLFSINTLFTAQQVQNQQMGGGVDIMMNQIVFTNHTIPGAQATYDSLTV